MNRRYFMVGVVKLLIVLTVFDSKAEFMPQDHLRLVQKWNPAENGIPEFTPTDIAISRGDVYISDKDNHRINVFQLDGSFLHSWGEGGSGPGQFQQPTGISISPDNFIYVVDRMNYRIQVFQPNGKFVREWGGMGDNDGQFSYLVEPYKIDVSSANEVYVLQKGSSGFCQIQVFQPDGTFLRKWGSAGAVSGSFTLPSDLAVSDDGYVYVADSDNDRIQKFDSDGLYITQFGGSGSRLTQGRLNSTEGIDVGKDGRVYVSDRWNDRIRIFESDGETVGMYGASSINWIPGALAVDFDSRRILVTDYWSDYVSVYEFGYRIQSTNRVPVPQMLSFRKRDGSNIADIDYIVWDPDSSEVDVAVLACMNGSTAFSNTLRMTSFIEGTDANIGVGIPANVTKHLAWDYETDLNTNVVSMKLEFLAKDRPYALGLEFVTLPSVGTNAPLTINRASLTENDLTSVWRWLIATGDANISFKNGEVRGVVTPFSDVVLYNGTTTDDGEDFLFDMLGVQKATISELSRANLGVTPGVTNSFLPEKTTWGSSGYENPGSLNEVGFQPAGNDWRFRVVK